MTGAPLTCPDCSGTATGEQVLKHDDTCPVSAALDAMSQLDREWFAAHPGATEYYRPLVPGDLHVAHLDSVVLGTVDGKTPRVRVRQIGEGVRVRSLPGNLVLRADTLDALRLLTMLRDAPTLPRGWADGGAA